MKNTLFLLSALLISLSVNSQITIKLNIDYERVATQRGELYQYSSYYLAINDVQTASDTSFLLKSIRIAADSVKPALKHSQPKREYRSLPVPLNEDAITATNTAKKAESVAKQIYRIREARLNLLTGEAEHTPADAGSLNRMLAELNKMERQLTELFVGKKDVCRLHKTITYIPQQSEDIEGAVLMRFSKFDGPVAADDLSGTPIYIDVRYIREEVPQPKKKKNDPVITRIIGAYIKIYDSGQTLLEGKI